MLLIIVVSDFDRKDNPAIASGLRMGIAGELPQQQDAKPFRRVAIRRSMTYASHSGPFSA